MTLKQAFTMWAFSPKNTVLAARSRDAVQRVLMKKWNDIELEQFTESFCRRIFYQSTEPLEMKVKAASILVHILQWGADNGHCNPPTFTLSIASEEHKRAVEDKSQNTNDTPKKKRIIVPTLAEIKGDLHMPDDNEPIVNVKPEALARRKAEQEARNETKTEEDMEPKKTRGKQPKPVAQLDAKTLQVIKVWPSRSEAERELGACNLDRAIIRKRMAAGFFWCSPEDADSFTPNPKSNLSPKPEPRLKPKPSPAMKNEPTTVDENAVRNAARKALEVFSDDELLDELDRRGWQGELRHVQIVSIGKSNSKE